MSDLNISTRENGGIIVVDLAGRIALGDSSAALHEKLRDVVNEGKNRVLINLKGVTTIDSSGLGTLVAAYTTVEKNNGQMKLVNLPERVTELMTITKLYTVFEIFDNEQTAIDSFTRAEAAAE